MEFVQPMPLVVWAAILIEARYSLTIHSRFTHNSLTTGCRMCYRLAREQRHLGPDRRLRSAPASDAKRLRRLVLSTPSLAGYYSLTIGVEGRGAQVTGRDC